MSLATFDPASVERFTHAFEDLFDAADPASMTSYYTEQAHLMADGMQPIQGHAAITEFWHTAMARAAAAGARRTIRLHEAHCSGDLGYALCTVTVHIPAAGDAAGTTVAAWDATVWRRDPAGGWRIEVDISTRLPPAASAQD
jgi:uncharacterized protein (TIGR02246 family)